MQSSILSRSVMGALFVATILLLFASTSALAQGGDRPGHNMVEVWRDMDVPPAPVLSPEAALKSFTLQPGYRIELVAAEPLVSDPVIVKVDEDGRLWVVEMRGYMPNVDGTGEEIRTGRIGVLEDVDGDGRMDKRTDFLEGLQMPRAIAFVNGGVLVAEPPNLFFCRDLDGDLRCDSMEIVLRDYGVQGPVEVTDNGLLRGLDNWLYNARSDKRLRFIDGKWVLKHDYTRGQWGISQDDYGRLYFNQNTRPLRVDLIPGRYYTRNRNHTGRAGVDLTIYKDIAVWTDRVNPGINRGYMPEMLRDGKLSTFTAACSPTIYRGGNYPADVRGDAFICEPCGNLVRHQKIIFSEAGASSSNAYEKAEWLTSTDERFRPVSLCDAPDGSMYVVDMYRGIIQHKLYLTTFLRKQIIERKLDNPLGLGRIYRVVHESKPVGPKPQLSNASASQLVSLLSHSQGWWRDTAQRLLVDRGDASIAPELKRVAQNGQSELARLHALWTLEGLGAVDGATVERALRDSHPQVRIAGLRLAERPLSGTASNEADEENQLSLLQSVLALRDDPSIEVLRQFALSLGEVRLPEAEPALRSVLGAHAEDQIVRDGALSGLGGRELEFLQRALADAEWDNAGGRHASVVRQLAACVARERNAGRVDRLLSLALKRASGGDWRGKAILDGVVSAATTKGRAPKPIAYKQQPASFAKLLAHKLGAISSRAKKLEKFLVWGEAAKPLPPPRALTKAEAKRFAEGKTLFQMTCAACHMPDGLGQEGKAPPLLDSPFLLGSPERLIRIVQNGVTGPITVHGRVYDMTMPGLQGISDEQIASILTYARREWEHRADPIDAATVTRAKKAIGGREIPWTEKELLKIK